jgi:hypothetical protein
MNANRSRLRLASVALFVADRGHIGPRPSTRLNPGRGEPRHRHQEFLAFLKQVVRAHPDAEQSG